MNTKIAQAPIIGIVRYSQKITFVDSQKDIFEPEYFEYRYRIFVEVTLRSLQQQTNTNFVVIVLHSETIPLEYKKRFLNLESRNSFLYNVFIKDTQESFEKAIADSQTYVSYKNDTAITFRIDNDDAVQSNFIEKMSHFLKSKFNGYSVSIPKQYIVKRVGQDEYLLQENYYPANSMGLAYITQKESYKTVMELGQHHLTNENTGMILLESSTYGGLMTINGENAINTMDETKAKIYNKTDLYYYLKEKKIENINLECLRIFEKENRISFKKILKLFIPPIVNIIEQKIKSLFR